MTPPLFFPLVFFFDFLRNAIAMITSRVAENAHHNANKAFEALQSLRENSKASQNLITTIRPPLSTTYRKLA